MQNDGKERNGSNSQKLQLLKEKVGQYDDIANIAERFNGLRRQRPTCGHNNWINNKRCDNDLRCLGRIPD